MWEPMQLGPSSRLWGSHSPRRTSVAFPPPFSERPRTKPGIEAALCPVLSRVPLSPNPVDLREESDWRYLQLSDPWPDLELFRTLPFDYTVHDPKYEDASLICSHHQSAKSQGQAPACLPCLPGRGSSLWKGEAARVRDVLRPLGALSERQHPARSGGNAEDTGGSVSRSGCPKGLG